MDAEQQPDHDTVWNAPARRWSICANRRGGGAEYIPIRSFNLSSTVPYSGIPSDAGDKNPLGQYGLFNTIKFQNDSVRCRRGIFLFLKGENDYFVSTITKSSELHFSGPLFHLEAYKPPDLPEGVLVYESLQIRVFCKTPATGPDCLQDKMQNWECSFLPRP